MVETVGGAVKIKESEASPTVMASTMAQLLAEDRLRIVEMRESIQRYKQKTQAPDLCSVVQQAIGKL